MAQIRNRELLLICEMLDTNRGVEVERILERLNEAHRQKTLQKGKVVVDITKGELNSNYLKALRQMVKEEPMLADKSISIDGDKVYGFKGLLEFYENRGRANAIPKRVIEFIRGNLNYALLNQIQNYLIERSEAMERSTKTQELPHPFISLDESCFPETQDEIEALQREQKMLEEVAYNILYKRPIAIEYRPIANGREGIVDRLIFHPEYLRRIGPKWIIYGMSRSEHMQEQGLQSDFVYVNIVLNRIVKITPIDNMEFMPSGIDYTTDPFKDQMTYHSYYVGTDTPKERVLLRVRKRKYGHNGLTIHPFERILLEPLHHSQRIVEEDHNYGTISLEVTDAIHIWSILLQWGSDIEVLAPQSLRRRISNEVKRLNAMYNGHHENRGDTKGHRPQRATPHRKAPSYHKDSEE